MKLGKRKWVKGGRPERSGFDENLLKFGGPGGGAARRTSKKAKTNVSKTGKADSTASGVEEMGGRSAKLQSRKSGANLAGNARRKIPRGDLTPPSGWGPGMGSPVPRQKLLQRQAKKDAKAKERIKKEKVKEKIGGMVKRAKRDKELEGKIGKKGLEEAQKAYKGLYGDWNLGGRTGIVKRK